VTNLLYMKLSVRLW